MSKPNIRFFVIGAARSGTTSLYRYLEQHPEIYTSPVKEPRFFAENWKKGWAWYEEIYAGAPPEAVLGDFSPSYTVAERPEDQRAAPRLARFYPEARLIYMIRNPIACAISNWRMAAEITGKEIPFLDAFRNDWAWSVYHRCCFFRQITPFRQLFSDAQILVIPLEAIRSTPDEWTAKIHDHIGISPIQARFPKSNASNRKPNRPKAPDIDRAARKEFLDKVQDDALQMLDYIGMPASLWNLSVNSPDWEPE